MKKLPHSRIHKKIFTFFILTAISLLLYGTGRNAHGEAGATRITILYDNYEYDPDCTTGWGFSCLIDTESAQVLFDTGADGKTLLKNMRALGVEARDIDVVVISHMHGDHTGGLFDALEHIGACTVYFPVSVPQSFESRATRTGSKCVVSESFREIYPHIYTTGALGKMIKEQALVVDTQKGLIVVTGCAHPGVVLITEEAARHFEKDIALVMGGFHLFSTDAASIQEIIVRLKDLGVKKVAPCHCSGDRARAMFHDAYGERFLDAGAGRVLKLEDL
jgi:7,8-dihydropterin-6-yl-methyl-4-(beta-D-ribofuranosyl)aminobenzene 5'-phosphate synthase